MITCTFEDDGQGELRHVVVDAVAIKNNKILLGKRASHLTNPGKYCLPGGFLNRDEEAEQAVLRELQEETGYVGEVVKLLRVVDNPNRKGEDRQNVSFVYLINVGEKVSEPDNETKAAVWFPLDQLPQEEDIAFDHYEIIKKYLTTVVRS